MRDPKRIKPLLKTLEDVWNDVPDWRFGQLICNMLGTFGRDPFYVEDDEMQEFMKKYLSEEK